MILYHYTCDHGAAGIRRSGIIRPHALLPGPKIVWLTDLEVPDRAGLGLTSRMLPCDRTAHRFTVETVAAHHWGSVRHLFSRSYVDALELTPGALPVHWWITTLGIPIEAA